jgi:hypothetical protein
MAFTERTKAFPPKTEATGAFPACRQYPDAKRTSLARVENASIIF